MKIAKLLVGVAVVSALATGCSVRLVDFTTISSKNVNLTVDRAAGKRTEGKKSYFLGIGWNIKDALDKALENAGPDYDMLIDGVVRSSSYFFVTSVKVEGVAVKSNVIKKEMGEDAFKGWLKTQNVFDPSQARK